MGCKTTSKVRKQTPKKDFHYDQKKYICELISLVHTFAVHKSATTGNFSVKDSVFQSKGKTARGTIVPVPLTSNHIVSNPLTSTLYAQQAV